MPSHQDTRATPARTTPGFARISRHMEAVQAYGQSFQGLQTGWDNLTLLGQLSGTGIDTGPTRQAFQQLTSHLLEQLGHEVLDKTVLAMRAKAQVAVDIMVRNLFERTADIGFLATDEDIRAFLLREREVRSHYAARRELQDDMDSLRARFAEYVAKYSVYHDIVLLDTEGRVLLRLDDSVSVETSRDPLVAEALGTRAAYVEAFRHIDLLPAHEQSLVYAYRVEQPGDQAPLGVLCLCFRFDDETRRIFANLREQDHDQDWSVVLLTDANGRVIASSDAHHIPTGVQLAPVLDGGFSVQRFGPHEYLATSAAATPYQGYGGPGWHGHVMLPLQHAFERSRGEALRHIDPQALQAVMRSPAMFGERLRDIPLQADEIQRALNRSIWNGHVRMSRQQQSGTAAVNSAFAKVLLQEVGNSGERTKALFAESINDLHETVVSAVLHDSAFLAALAIDIMDRNLYERANDCRWWALTSAFRELLAEGGLDAARRHRIGEVLRYINGLYTVYSDLIVFDTGGKVVASSRSHREDAADEILREEWVRRVLALEDSQGYVVSEFAPSPLYDGAPTYIYGAAIRSPDGSRVVGGVGIVFDGSPQFAAMLRDALPRDEAGNPRQDCLAAFIDAQGCVLSASDERLRAGTRLPAGLAQLADGDGDGAATSGSIIEWQGRLHAVGTRRSAGYREYKGEGDAYRNEVTALVMVPVGEAQAATEVAPTTSRPQLHGRRQSDEGACIELATFRVGEKWFALKPEEIVEALPGRKLSTAPGAGPDFGGYLMYEGTPVPVFDIRHIAQAGEANEAGDALPQVILLANGPGNWLGVLADELGPIPELPVARMKPVPGMIAGASVISEAIVPTDEAEQLLPILCAARIAQRMGGTEPDRSKLQLVTPAAAQTARR
ncbi:MAG: chemotaxis protein CheW [Moraxellaceae bacterium]|nr:chemotaxis protein CheW [Moraxellaceae bacterium]